GSPSAISPRAAAGTTTRPPRRSSPTAPAATTPASTPRSRHRPALLSTRHLPRSAGPWTAERPRAAPRSLRWSRSAHVGSWAGLASGATGNVRLVPTESESVIASPTCANESRARPARHQQPAGHDLEGPRSAMGIQAVAIERCSDLAEPRCAQLAPVWELVASIPAPGCDHRQHEDPALA